MRFTRLVQLLGILFMLSACAVFDSEPGNQVVQPQPASEGQANLLALSPLQQKAFDLKNSPDRYLQSAVVVSEPIRVRYREALAAKRHGQHQQAQTLLLQLTQQAPELSGPWLHLGDIIIHDLSLDDDSPSTQQAFHQAMEYYRAAINVNPHNYYAHNRLAMLLRERGEFELAKAHYQQAINSWAGFDKAYLNLGILYDLYLNNKHLALKQYDTYQLLQEEPDRQVKGWIADIARQLKQQHSQTAVSGEGL